MTGPIYYEGVTTRRILDQIARQRGWDPTRYAIALEELERMCQLASQALETAWRFAPWPQLTLTQRVAYRPDWTPEETYEEGAQVYHRGGYHEALRDGVTSEPGAEDADADWTRCEAWMVCGISYVRYGIDEIDLARGVYALDPDRRADALPLPAGRVAYGAVVRQRPGAVVYTKGATGGKGDKGDKGDPGQDADPAAALAALAARVAALDASAEDLRNFATLKDAFLQLVAILQQNAAAT